jgi:hypothetical protein
MKKSFLLALVGAILIFAWQTASWTFLNLHGKAQQHTPKQDSILAFINAQGLAEGGYYMPRTPDNATPEEMEKCMKDAEGKPWVQLFYHKEMKMNSSTMMMNMGRGLVANIVMVWLLVWILLKVNRGSFVTYFTASLFTGLIVFINAPYTGHIWYSSFDLYAHLTDALVGWGLCGLWLGWRLGKTGDA